MLVTDDHAAFNAEIERHASALEGDKVRHNLILAMLTRLSELPPRTVRFWSFTKPGSCAVQTGERNIVLGDLAASDVPALVDTAWPFPGLVGPEEHVRPVVDLCEARGISFQPPILQAINALDTAPRFPASRGAARVVLARNKETLARFVLAFIREAVPFDPVPDDEAIAKAAASGRFLFWGVDDEPVAMAAKSRDLGSVAAIAPVYTVPEHRGRGYAGSVTATLCERLLAEGRQTICLYTDLSNPAANRCYARIGFKPVCRSLLIMAR